MTASITRAAVVGGGYMGGGIAATIAGAGIPCTLIDVDTTTARRRTDELICETANWAADGLLDPAEANAVTTHLSAGTDIEESVAAVDFIIEAVPEILELKHTTLARISAAATPECLIASNTSTLPIGTLAESVEHPERFLGCHWMNPSRLIPGVEIIPWTGTAEEAVDVASEFHTRVGKRPTTIGDVPGFIANRLQHALFAEALKLVDEGVATPETVDEVSRNSFGYRLAAFGPFEVADMAGLDVYQSCLEVETEHYGDRFASTPLLEDLVSAGSFGLKNGRGITPLASHDPEVVGAIRNRYFRGLTSLLESVEGLEGLRHPRHDR
ncbi:MAG: 3-hydroxyacyl-CoA dehydrogenase family protein [Brevibacterium yomogidense]